MIIELPELPPPLSACFINVFPRGRAISPRYKAWKKLIHVTLASRLNRDRDGEVVSFSNPVQVEYHFRRPDNKRRQDLGNLEKATSDILVSLGVIEDDSLIHDLRMRWGSDAAVTIKIESMT